MNDSHDPADRQARFGAPLLGRRALLAGFGATALVAGMGIAPGEAHARTPVARRIGLKSIHTGESIDVTFQEHGHFDPRALDEINHVLRDHRTGDVEAIDPALLVLLTDLRTRMDSNASFNIISGYRSPRTNAALAAKSGGVAKKSFHMRGMAIDCNLPGRDLLKLHKAARAAKAGGVGLYQRSNFVHMDTGRVRYW
ncbi:MAG: DUF882 domain-containing protein [Minwuia sp.]|uniref:DUF882 domain-containing protein n=1 Tax=Minwuia sp. TaxID=2493630 RepID=UPI003A8A31ED